MAETNEEAAARIHDIMVKSGTDGVARSFAAQANVPLGHEVLSNDMRIALAAEDARLNVTSDVVGEAIGKLTHEQREAMAALALAGYRFHRGTFYWRCVSPTNMLVDSLQPELAICIAKAMVHNEERTNVKHPIKP